MELEQEHKKDWESVSGDFYFKQKNSLNPIRRWFHRNRYRRINELVKDSYKQGIKIADLGSGSCEWNTDKMYVIGIDFSKNMLDFGIKHGNLAKGIQGDIRDKHFKDKSIDIIVMSEVIEHIEDSKNLLKIVYDMLKPEGILIMSVPYDTTFSLWRPLFKIQYFIQWNLLRNAIYKGKIGHVNHFSPESIKRLLTDNGFIIDKIFSDKRFSIFAKAKKD